MARRALSFPPTSTGYPPKNHASRGLFPSASAKSSSPPASAKLITDLENNDQFAAAAKKKPKKKKAGSTKPIHTRDCIREIGYLKQGRVKGRVERDPNEKKKPKKTENYQN